MAVPKKRNTKSRRDRRRMHIFLKVPHFVKCPKCGRLILPHTVCPYCGYYKEMEVINVFKGLTKRQKKRKEKELKTKEKPLTLEELSKK